MLPRFFVPEAGRGAAESIALPEEEAAHAVRVMRLAVGDAIRVFDGEGGEWRAEIAEVSRRQVRLTLHERVTPAPEPRIAIALAVAVLKGDKMDDVVRDAVMLGASAIQPLMTERTEVGVATLARGTRGERWQRIAVSSCKQCGRAVVPRVRAPLPFESWLRNESQLRLVLVEPNAVVPAGEIHGVPPPAAAELAVGPEGGWTDGELRAAASAGARLVTLGGLTLRADAAPLVALTAIRTVWRDL